LKNCVAPMRRLESMHCESRDRLQYRVGVISEDKKERNYSVIHPIGQNYRPPGGEHPKHVCQPELKCINPGLLGYVFFDVIRPVDK
jgi:hypothetical protein